MSGRSTSGDPEGVSLTPGGPSGSPLSGIIGHRRAIALQALGCFAGWGYREIEVPLLDYFEPLRKALDPRQISRMFRFMDRDGNLLVLRADVTPAIAKTFAYQLADVPLPLRVCYVNKVLRIERAFTREQIESYQLGIELIGASGRAPEVEVILVAAEALEALGVGDFEVHLGNVAIGERLTRLTGAGEEDQTQLRRHIAARDPDAVRELLAAVRAPARLVEPLVGLTRLWFGDGALAQLRSSLPEDAELVAAIAAVEELQDLLAALGLADRLYLDLGLTNEQGYYTGTAFQIVSERVGRRLGGGGRYDGLIGRFGRNTPAVGFSLHLDALLEVLPPVERDGGPAPAAADEVRHAGDIRATFESALARRRSGQAAVIDYERDDA